MKPKNIRLALVASILALAGTGVAAPAQVILPEVAPETLGLDSAVLDKIDATVAGGIAGGLFPGAVVCIGRHGKIAFLRAYGNRVVAAGNLPAKPMTTDAVFDIASITKPMATATSIMILYERGMMESLDDPVCKYLAEYNAPEIRKKITLRQLLTHTSGLGGRVPKNTPPAPAPAVAPDELPAAPRDEIIYTLTRVPAREPGSAFHYTGTNMDVLAILLERLDGRDISTFANAEIFRPLGMAETGFLPGKKLRERAAPTRENLWDAGKVYDPSTVRKQGVAGAAGVFSTARDLAVFATMMLHNGRLPGGARILKPETVALMTTAGAGAASVRCLGWEAGPGYTTKMSPRSFAHGGHNGTRLQMDPGSGLFVIFLSNRTHQKSGAPEAARTKVYQLAGAVGNLAVESIK
ncbi:MAG: beta-lactamase family protein [Opitutaceae bacterium]|jgi:CubicO group peptidase (beta-lactamase class C family)|nr:beta-lactamase family protein [Opitutaceae bacterium]